MDAAKQGDERALREAIEERDDVDLVDNNGRAPVHYAALNGHSDCVRTLIEAGCQVDLANNIGRTARSYAPELVDAILQEQNEARSAIHEALLDHSLEFSEMTAEQISSFTLPQY